MVWTQGPVSRKSRKFFRPEKPFLKLQTAYSIKLVFHYDFKMRKGKLVAKFHACKCLRSLRSTIGERSPKLGVPVVTWFHVVTWFPVATYHVILQAWRIEIFWVDGRCAKSAPFWILNKNYAHASIYFYQEHGRARALRAQLFSAENLSKIVAGSQRVTSCERTLRGSKGIQPSLVSSIHFFKL